MYSYNNGDVYRGQFVHGKRHGKGELGKTCTFCPQSTISHLTVVIELFPFDLIIFQGLFSFQSLNLHFCVVFRNGNRYVGDFHNDKRSGVGHFQWKSTGNSYEGQFVNDKRTGKGIYYYCTGEKYSGGFMNGRKHGLGLSSVRKKLEDGGEEAITWQEEWHNGSLVSRERVSAEVPRAIITPGTCLHLFRQFFGT